MERSSSGGGTVESEFALVSEGEEVADFELVAVDERSFAARGWKERCCRIRKGRGLNLEVGRRGRRALDGTMIGHLIMVEEAELEEIIHQMLWLWLV